MKVAKVLLSLTLLTSVSLAHADLPKTNPSTNSNSTSTCAFAMNGSLNQKAPFVSDALVADLLKNQHSGEPAGQTTPITR